MPPESSPHAWPARASIKNVDELRRRTEISELWVNGD
ncbi:hypothetical protein HD598_002477 [Neomicrococcus aestuarii]|uniref:Uncharacterized protein n=1 Tax=Neomicrococcus aestuarii TaxID=556325 RepID=A0A7W8TX50_9MICC|nr:hypothetical protein [Neomicrococcus aestuarii]